MGDLALYEDTIAEIAARLDLREPNREAVRTINAAVSQYYDVEEQQPPFEAIIDSATGVGKTYILTGAMELFVAAYGVRDFVIVTPGRTILEKTQDNFTPGHPKSLLGPMSFRPVVITSENFATPAMRAAMDDDTQVKIYLFTVQSLIRPESKVGRKTHKFQEGLGTEFYAHLQSIGQLVVFADEHHCYYGPCLLEGCPRARSLGLARAHRDPGQEDPAGPDHLPLPPCGGYRRQAREDARDRRTKGRSLRSSDETLGRRDSSRR